MHALKFFAIRCDHAITIGNSRRRNNSIMCPYRPARQLSTHLGMNSCHISIEDQGR